MCPSQKAHSYARQARRGDRETGEPQASPKHAPSERASPTGSSARTAIPGCMQMKRLSRSRLIGQSAGHGVAQQPMKIQGRKSPHPIDEYSIQWQSSRNIKLSGRRLTGRHATKTWQGCKVHAGKRARIIQSACNWPPATTPSCTSCWAARPSSRPCCCNTEHSQKTYCCLFPSRLSLSFLVFVQLKSYSQGWHTGW